MRIKTLLIAAAALAVGIISSEAQVYSQNIVGYANVPCNDAYAFYMMQCPFNVGVSNGANEIFGTNLPDTSEILTWNADANAFTTAVYDGSQGNGIYWYLSDGITPGPAPILLPGNGFYLYAFGTCTNTFAGSVAVSSGATNTTTLATPYEFYLVGSTIPYSGYVTNVVNGTSQGVNLNGLPDTSEVQLWDEPSGTFTTYIYDTSQGNGIFWYQSDGITPGPCPSVNVGQAFFIYPFDVFTWKQSLP
jgi:hypothetical protein